MIEAASSTSVPWFVCGTDDVKVERTLLGSLALGSPGP